MKAPTYRPSAAFEEPEKVPQRITTSNTSIAEFMSNPQARAALLSEVPQFEKSLASPQIQPHLGNLSPRTMMMFGNLKAETLDRVDKKLAELPLSAGTR